MAADDLETRVRARLSRLSIYLTGYDAFVGRAEAAATAADWREAVDAAAGALDAARGELDAFRGDLDDVAADPELSERLARGTGITSLSEWAVSARALLERCESSLRELSQGWPQSDPVGDA